MKVKTKVGVTGIIILLLTALPNLALAGIPQVNHVMVTDVTTVSFSVIWAASEPSKADLEVFEDEDAVVPVTSVTIEPHPVESDEVSIREYAQNNGVMKVRVTGLAPDTTYFFRTLTTSKLTAESTIYPDSSPLLSVHTELKTVRTYTSGMETFPFSNDVIIKACYLEDGTTPAEGTLLLATVKGANHPITAFVGDGVGPPYALIDLNNVFSRDFSENLDLQSGENLTLVNFRGISGYSIITHEVPIDQSLCEVKPPGDVLKIGRNMASLQLEPGNPDIESVLDPILGSVVSVWAFDKDQESWIFYARDGLPVLNELTSLHSFMGFWLYMENYASWLMQGTFDNNPIQLQAGRNLVGYKSIETLPIMEAIESIENELIAIWNFDIDQNKWTFYVKDGLPFLNELEYIEPGKAYWVYVANDCQW